MRLIAAEFDHFADARLDAEDGLPPEDHAPVSGPALEGLYHAHFKRLLRFFSRRAGPDDAPDLVQETFVRLAGIDPAAREALQTPGAFLTRIATNLLKDRAKSAARRSAVCHLVYDEQIHAGLDPHRLLSDRDALARLDAAVQRLNRRTREIFLLHRVEGLTYVEIADEVGMSVKGVKKQMAKALFQLRRDVGPL